MGSSPDPKAAVAAQTSAATAAATAQAAEKAAAARLASSEAASVAHAGGLALDSSEAKECAYMRHREASHRPQASEKAAQVN